MSFIPRATFPSLTHLPRSYFLGHHKSGLQKMKSLLSTIDLVIECRDYRVPLTSRNPLFESSLEGKERLVVYTHRDLGPRGTRDEEVVKKWHAPTEVMFVRNMGEKDGGEREKGRSVRKVLEYLREHAGKRWTLVGHRVLVVGMPNVGKSTLLNALRAGGVGKGKVARTGAQPGVTRKISSGVKIIASEDDVVEGGGGRGVGDAVGGGVYLVDTPGVFIPYVPDAEAMMKLALCGSVKDAIISPVMLADYLLYHINLADPMLYAEYTPAGPTNDVVELLEGIARKTGRLGKGGKADLEATALWMVQRWRTGGLGRFLLDRVTETGLEESRVREGEVKPSISQARKAEKERRRERGRLRGVA
ncbi:mitochondrial GTPase 1 [Byssothecium circinans]|uniref:Mitochondrial GTPase 1 n=1 Tax=Byssothecium circinans TaxID=147558 RepID=A0A6A5UKN4_9PLEO|nr:mitochondrial GTPase 1 [Byssothecium circinans]